MTLVDPIVPFFTPMIIVGSIIMLGCFCFISIHEEREKERKKEREKSEKNKHYQQVKRLANLTEEQNSIISGNHKSNLPEFIRNINDLAEGRHDCGRGVWKQIDENRQLLELLLEDVPELLKKKPWIIAWCEKRDEFLTRFAKITKTENHLPNFPRPWPEVKEEPSFGMNEEDKP